MSSSEDPARIGRMSFIPHDMMTQVTRRFKSPKMPLCRRAGTARLSSVAPQCQQAIDSFDLQHPGVD
jgi:hypothetical protein